MQLFGLSRRRRRGGGGFDPSGLFANGEVGVWYDPSDLTPEKVSWRRNLLTWSEQFDNAAWTKAQSGVALAPVVTANAGTAPDGTQTADLVVFNLNGGTTSSDISQLQQSTPAFTVFTTYSIWARTSDGSTRTMSLAGPSGNITTITITTAWQRFSVTDTTIATASTARLRLRGGEGTSATASVFLWGAQLELGTTVGSYQRITDFSSDFLDAFPTHTLYQNSTGTTPVTVLSDPVGLVLDKSRWDNRGVVNLLTYSEQFDVLWSKDDVTVTANQTTAPDGTSTADLVAETATTVPHFVSQTVTAGVANYVFSVFAKKGTGATAPDWIQLAFGGTNSGYVNFNLSTGAVGVIGVGAASIENVGDGWYRCIASINNITAGSLGCRVAFTNNTNAASRNPSYTGATTSNVFVWGAQLERGSTVSAYQANVASVGGPGNHAIQTTSASRPTLQARTNFNVTSQITAGSGNSVTSNIATAPDGTNRAERVAKTDATATVYAVQNYITSFAMNNTTYVASRYFKYDGFNTTVSLEYNNGSNWGNSWIAVFTVTSTGITVSSQSGCVATVTDVGNGWYRCTARFTTTTITLAGSSYLIKITGASGVSVQTFGGQLELGTTASAFQFVSSATSYADVGAPRNLTFDGTDDSLVTAASVNFSGTDKMTVCAGVFKASDATFAPVVETSATSSTTNGAFAVFAPYSNTEQNYGLNSRGTSLVSIAGPASGAGALPAPNTSVLSMLTDISGPSALMRQNGATYISSVNSQGTGNYASHLLFIGRRNNATSPLNGRLYQLIVRGAATDSVTVINTERYVAQKTGVTL